MQVERDWTTEAEVALFEAMCQHKPIGIHRQAHFDAMHAHIERRIGVAASPSRQQMVEHLSSMFDLDRLDVLHAARAQAAEAAEASDVDAPRSRSHTRAHHTEDEEFIHYAAAANAAAAAAANAAAAAAAAATASASASPAHPSKRKREK
ncbi:hypothetical protein CAOG_006276 [Capsaspora owczarzaki ATCC 30864]|uniref:Uncharacterized protein n=1 Tax=Capsaspora owczarzaki (strain ATCC 30864) TaxID=595528 RepID=A0A0D2WUY0_CAPO3|nr:hypothetical protein CAOG_006276 [Capsaspora owczarzaki ATCC 30864]